MILKDTATFQVIFIVSLFCACNITTVEINSGVHLLKCQTCEVPLFTSGGLGFGLVILVLVLQAVVLWLGLVTLVLVLRIWSCLHQWLLDTTTLVPCLTNYVTLTRSCSKTKICTRKANLLWVIAHCRPNVVRSVTKISSHVFHLIEHYVSGGAFFTANYILRHPTHSGIIFIRRRPPTVRLCTKI